MNADRAHGFCEGMAVAVGIAALGFIVIKEMDAFFERRVRPSRGPAAHDVLGFHGITRNMGSRPHIDNIRVTSNGPPMNDPEMADLMSRAIAELDAQLSSNGQTDVGSIVDGVFGLGQHDDEGGDETSGPNDEGSTTGRA